MGIIDTWRNRCKNEDSLRICRNPDNGPRQGWFGSFVPQHQYLPEVVAKDDWAAIAKAVGHANPEDCVWDMLEVWVNCSLERLHMRTLSEYHSIGDMLEVLDPKTFDPVFVEFMGKSPFRWFRDILAETHDEHESKKQNAFKRKLVKAVKPEHFKSSELERIRKEQQEKGYFEFVLNSKTHVGEFSYGVGSGAVEVLETESERKIRLDKEQEEYERLHYMHREREFAEYSQMVA